MLLLCTILLNLQANINEVWNDIDSNFQLFSFSSLGINSELTERQERIVFISEKNILPHSKNFFLHYQVAEERIDRQPQPKLLKIRNEEADLGLETIQDLITFKNVEEALQKHQTLLARYSNLEKEFDAAVKSGVAKEKFAMEQTMESYREEIGEIKTCRKLLKEMGMDLECLQAERDAYLRVIRVCRVIILTVYSSVDLINFFSCISVQQANIWDWKPFRI